jgi:reactive intermediate/imine deaminase
MTSRQTEFDICCIDSREISLPAGHYSHVCTAGGMVYISGQLPLDEAGNSLSHEPFELQAARVLSNVDACLNAVGGTRADLVQVRVYVTSIQSWPTFDRIYAAWIGDHKPARAVAESPSLHYGSALEIEAVALQRR